MIRRRTPGRTLSWLILWMGCLLNKPVSATAAVPNVLLIMADDLGWMDLACQDFGGLAIVVEVDGPTAIFVAVP